MEEAITIPRSAELATSADAEVLYERYDTLARRDLESEGGIFTSVQELEMEVCRRILSQCIAVDTLNEAVRQRVFERIAREKLWAYSPEGWSGLADVVHDLSHGLSASGICEYATIAEVIAPFAERHSIPIPNKPGRLGHLREAASALKALILNPSEPEVIRAEKLREELDFIFSSVTRDEVRTRYRQPRGDPARGLIAESGNGTVALLIIAPTSAVAEAIRQRLGPLVTPWVHGDAAISVGTVRPSRSNKEQSLRTDCLSIDWLTTKVLDNKTGEIIEELLE